MSHYHKERGERGKGEWERVKVRGGLPETEARHCHSGAEEVVKIFGGVSLCHQEECDTTLVPENWLYHLQKFKELLLVLNGGTNLQFQW